MQPIVRERQEDIYGEQNSAERIGAIKGTYHPATRVFTLIASNLDNEDDARRTIRHELLGHYGLNTFTPDQKRDLLERVLETRHEPSLARVWQQVEALP